jgi:tripartite-type tricarboxylate transporter receptor subunit TctC
MNANGAQVAVSAVAAIFLIGVAGPAAAADEIADFYRGKTIVLTVGTTPGGGYDGDARVIARNIGRHIPGEPNVIVQNMPGARGLTAANHLYNLAPKDGTAMGILQRGHLTAAYLYPDGVRYDERKFNWIGSTGAETSVAIAWHTAPQKTVQDVRKKELVVGGAGDSLTFPKVFNYTMGTKFKIVTGYRGTPSVLLAMEKGEVDGIAYYSWSNIPSKNPDWLSEHKIHVLFQTGDEPNEALPDVPLAKDFALDEQKRKVLDLWLAPNTAARPYAMPPGVPKDRVTAVRKAFMDQFKDPLFLADAKKVGMEIGPKDGQYVQDLVNRLHRSPQNVIEQARKAGEQ